MTRKDTILVAVVINAGLLAILFATAVIYDEDIGEETMKTELAMSPTEPSQDTSIACANSAVIESPADSVDNLLKEYKSSDTTQIACAENVPVQAAKESPPLEITPSHKDVSSVPNKTPSPVKHTEKKEKPEEIVKVIKKDEPLYHTVKSGDNPWKIAKQYGVKYDDILRLNNLNEEKARNLKIGDKIRVK